MSIREEFNKYRKDCRIIWLTLAQRSVYTHQQTSCLSSSEFKEQIVPQAIMYIHSCPACEFCGENCPGCPIKWPINKSWSIYCIGEYFIDSPYDNEGTGLYGQWVVHYNQKQFDRCAEIAYKIAMLPWKR